MTSAEPLFDAGTAPDVLTAGLRVAAMLALLVGGAVIWIVWQRRARMSGRRSLSVVDRLGLGRSASVVLLSVDGRRMLVGISPEGIRMLRVLPEAAPDQADVAEAAEVASTARPSFAAALGRALSRRAASGAGR